MTLMALICSDRAPTSSMGEKLNETGFALNRRMKETGLRVAERIIPRFGLKIDQAAPPPHDFGRGPGFLPSGGRSVALARVSCNL